MSLLSLLADGCHNTGDYASSVNYCAEGLELAQQVGNINQEANLHVTWSMNLFEMEQLDEAFRHIDMAIGILEKEARKNPCYQTWDDLFYALGMKLSLLIDEKRYADADAADLLRLDPRVFERFLIKSVCDIEHLVDAGRRSAYFQIPVGDDPLAEVQERNVDISRVNVDPRRIKRGLVDIQQSGRPPDFFLAGRRLAQKVHLLHNVHKPGDAGGAHAGDLRQIRPGNRSFVIKHIKNSDQICKLHVCLILRQPFSHTSVLFHVIDIIILS